MEFKANNYKPSETFKFIRQCTGLTQEELAKRVNKSKNWVKSNEQDVTRYYFEDLLKIANMFDIEIKIIKK